MTLPLSERLRAVLSDFRSPENGRALYVDDMEALISLLLPLLTELQEEREREMREALLKIDDAFSFPTYKSPTYVNLQSVLDVLSRLASSSSPAPQPEQ